MFQLTIKFESLVSILSKKKLSDSMENHPKYNPLKYSTSPNISEKINIVDILLFNLNNEQINVPIHKRYPKIKVLKLKQKVLKV